MLHNYYKSYLCFCRVVIYKILVTFFIKLMSNYYLLKSTKLYENDGLSILYILSSSRYTVMLLLLLLIAFMHKQKGISYMAAAIIFILLFYFVYSAYFRNYALLFIKNNTANTSLQNGLLNIHPILIYYMYINTLCAWILIYLYDQIGRVDANSSSHLYFITTVSLIGIYLGAAWANQELNWGGPWSWDPVEIISLIGLLFFIKLLHNKTNWIMNKFVVGYALALWIVYIVIRLGALSTIHSFIRSSSSSLHFNASVIVIITYLSFLMLVLLKDHRVGAVRCSINKLYKFKIIILFVYTYGYILYLLLPNRVLITLPRLSNFFIFFFLGTIILYVILPNQSNPAKLVIIVSYFLYTLFSSAAVNLNIVLIMLLWLFVSNHIKIAAAVHLVTFLVYVVCFLFHVNMPYYNSATITTSYIYSSSTTSFFNGINNAYENFFFLKKQHIIFKFKNIFYHVTGFNVITNCEVSIHIFSKNFLLKYLFGIEILCAHAALVWFICILFIKIVYFNLKNRISSFSY